MTQAQALLCLARMEVLTSHYVYSDESGIRGKYILLHHSFYTFKILVPSSVQCRGRSSKHLSRLNLGLPDIVYYLREPVSTSPIQLGGMSIGDRWVELSFDDMDKESSSDT